MLVGSDLRLTYSDSQNAVNAVDGVSLRVAEKEFVGIVGPSGSGKSSLLYLLAGLKLPTAGEVTFRDRSLGALTQTERTALRRASFGFVFQQSFLINYLTGLENVLVGSENGRDRGEALLDELRIAHVRDKFPYQMSAGERQRVAIARAIIHKPDVVFADEPTAALDRANADIVVEHLERTAEQGTLFIVTHDESILKSASRVLRMYAGKIAQGS